MKNLSRQKIVDINEYKAQRLASRCKSYAEELAEQFHLQHGGSLSVFRANASSQSYYRTAYIVMGQETERGFDPDLPRDRLEDTISTGRYQDVCGNLYFIGFSKNNIAYFSIYRNDGDSPEDVLAFLWSMNQFVVSNDNFAA